MKTYWWKGTKYPNLGDEMTQIILRNLFKVEPVHTDIGSAQLASTGSLLGWVWETPRRELERPLHIVGSGFMTSDTILEPLEFLRIHSVRGYLSKNKLGKLNENSISVGDPGLLISEVLGSEILEPTVKTKYGIILHHKHAENQEVKDRFDHLPVKFLDIRTDDLVAFVREMNSCEVIVSQSLHGLIFADALGIPNVWMELGPIHAGGAFKFYDYFSSVGRDFSKKIAYISKTESVIDSQINFPDAMRLNTVKNQVRKAFERALSNLESDV